MFEQSETLLYSMLLKLRSQLQTSNHRLVLAESCTAGLVAAELGQIPGISDYFCGSMVVYRTPTKTAWLDIDPDILSDPDIGPVSEEVTQRLLLALLERTPEATLSAAITGHLGPSAPVGMDGRIYCGFARRDMVNQRPPSLQVDMHVLTAPCPMDRDDLSRRRARQLEAAEILLKMISDQLHR
jgi:nicotinamide-nucleotide amidase